MINLITCSSKNFNRYMFHKTKKCFFSSKNVLKKHKENCLNINGVQSVRVEKGTIEFKSYFKQIPVPSKIYADFECILVDVEIYEKFYTRKISSSHSL